MDIRDAINNLVGRDVYPKISNVEQKSGAGAVNCVRIIRTKLNEI